MAELRDDPEERVQWVYASSSPGEVRDRYDQWADQYDQDLTESYDYALPRLTALDFVRWVNPPARVLDAGVGTGLVGVELAQLGFEDLVGIDISPGMLAKANETGLYRETREMTLGEPLDYPTDNFDAVTSVGTFTDGHAPATGFLELCRVTRPGGHVVAAIRDDIIVSHGFEAVFEDLESAGVWSLVARTEPRVAMPKTEPDLTVETWCFKIL